MKTLLILITALALAFGGCATTSTQGVRSNARIAATAALLLQKDTTKRTKLAQYLRIAGNVLVAFGPDATPEEVRAALAAAIPKGSIEAAVIAELALDLYVENVKPGGSVTARDVGLGLLDAARLVTPAN